MSKKYQIIYLHGWGSSPDSKKVMDLQKEFSDIADVTAPTLTHSPINTHKAIFEHIEQQAPKGNLDNVILVGTSLGGFWADVVGRELLLRTVLINPSTQPHLTLLETTLDKLDYQGNPHTKLTSKDLKTYETLSKDTDARNIIMPTTVLLSEDDNIIDYMIAYDKYKCKCAIVIYGDGGHRFNKHDTINKQVRETLMAMPG